MVGGEIGCSASHGSLFFTTNKFPCAAFNILHADIGQRFRILFCLNVHNLSQLFFLTLAGHTNILGFVGLLFVWCIMLGEDAVEFGWEEVLGGFLGFGAQALGLLNLPQ